jgi:hypothetical protein
LKARLWVLWTTFETSYLTIDNLYRYRWVSMMPPAQFVALEDEVSSPHRWSGCRFLASFSSRRLSIPVISATRNKSTSPRISRLKRLRWRGRIVCRMGQVMDDWRKRVKWKRTRRSPVCFLGLLGGCRWNLRAATLSWLHGGPVWWFCRCRWIDRVVQWSSNSMVMEASVVAMVCVYLRKLRQDDCRSILPPLMILRIMTMKWVPVIEWAHEIAKSKKRTYVTRDES